MTWLWLALLALPFGLLFWLLVRAQDRSGVSREINRQANENAGAPFT